MGKVLWHTMMSLDGFIAGPNDEMEWMSGIDGGEGRKIDEVLGSTGALLSADEHKTLRTAISRASTVAPIPARSSFCCPRRIHPPTRRS